MKEVKEISISMHLYKNPKYYEIAFSFRNILHEVDFFEKAIKKFSKVKVKKVFELASGTNPYLEEWHRRSYKYFGLDLNPEMLDFVRKRAKEKGIEVELFRGNMNRFSLGKTQVDLAYVLLGSLYATSNKEFFQHLDCVSKVLRRGGLYLLDGVVWFNLFGDNKQQWTISKRGIKIRATFRAEIMDEIAQTFSERATLDIDDHGVRNRLTSNEVRKFFFPQEFLTLIECHSKFEFLGWFNNFNLDEPAMSRGATNCHFKKKVTYLHT